MSIDLKLALCKILLNRKMGDESLNVAFYTVFFGTDTNNANCVHEVPTQLYPCYYFTNNETTLQQAKSKGWLAIHLDLPLLDNVEQSTMQAKFLKAKPSANDILKKYNYTVYFDSKLEINVNNILSKISTFPINKSYILKTHPYLPNNVWGELTEALLQSRYKDIKDKIIHYMEDMLSMGFQAEFNHLYATGVIIRNMKHPKTNQIDDAWYTHIQKCGIECQISFFFVNQLFHPFIVPDGYGEDYMSKNAIWVRL